ncbi:hypothetical protein CSA37_09345 [Candidatus Fermentibacteria bacterium]|nr:MAG: hypothetical protein CSA37_09345 [Candidatus Fermentibacteria bacterium]
MRTELNPVEGAGRIVLAVILGLLIWISAIDEKVFPVEYRIPLEVDVPGNYAALSVSADTVALRYTGSGWDMLRFQLGRSHEDLRRDFVPAEGSEMPLDSNLELSVPALQPDGQVQLSQVVPGAIFIKVDTVITKMIPVAPVFSDGIPARYRFHRVNPEMITVEGPASIVNLMDSLRTDSVFPGSEPVIASLALTVEKVAYSDDSVTVSVFNPSLPTRSRIFSTVAY